MKKIKNSIFLLSILAVSRVFAAGLTLSTTPDGLFRPADQITVRWKEPIQCRLRYGPASGVYPHLTASGGTGELSFTPMDEGMAPGVYFCSLVSGSLTSAEFKLMVESPKAPYMTAPANNSTVNTTTPEFRWDPIPGVPYYHFILSDQEVTLFEDANGDLQLDGGNIIWQIITPNTSAVYGVADPSGFFNAVNNNLPPIMQDMEYNWIVLNNYNNHPGYSSIVQSGVFSFWADIDHDLQPTALLAPVDDVELDGETILFRWQSNPTAKAYHFLLSETRPQDGSESSYLIWAPIITETSIECPAKRLLKNGRYFWRVVALDESGCGIGSMARNFTYGVPMGTLVIRTRQLGGGLLPRVEIDIVPKDGSSEISRLLTTDSGGLDNKVHPGTYTIFARKEGYADTSATATVGADEIRYVNLNLKKLVQSISGRVVNQNNQPVPRARITVSTAYQNRLTLETDIGGGFDIPVSPGLWTVFAHKTGHENSDTLSVTVLRGQKKVLAKNLRLMRKTADLSGTVTTPNGVSIQNARIQAIGAFSSQQAKTSELGRFAMQLAAGTWELYAEKDGYIRSPFQTVRLSPGQNLTLTSDFILQPQASVVTGFVMSEEKLLPGAVLGAVPLRGRTVNTRSDAMASFLFSLSQGNYTLQARLDGYVAPGDISFELAENQTISGLYVLMQRASCRIKGFVTRGGQPVAGAVVFCESATDTTLADGSYTLWVPPGTFLVDVVYKGLLSPGGQTVTLQQDAVRENVNFAMSARAGVVGGRVTSDGFMVAAARISTGNGRTFYSLSDGNGHYWLTLPPGIWDLDCTKPGFLPGRFDGAAVQAGQTVYGVDFAMELSQTGVHGTVTDGNGRPVQKAYVHVVDGGLAAATDHAGRYVLALDAGPCRLKAEKTGCVTQQRPVTISSGRSIVQDFVLLAKGFVHGKVVSEDGVPLDDVTVTADNGVPVLSRTDYAGYYQLYLLPGGYDLTVDRMGYAPQSSSLNLAYGDTLEFDFTLTADPSEIAVISGRILDSQSDALGGTGIRLSGDTNERVIYTDPDGGYTTGELESGRHYTLQPFGSNRFFLPPFYDYAELGGDRNRQDFGAALYGDVSGNEKVSSFDGSLILRHKAEQDVSPYFKNFPRDSIAADVSGNGEISPFDASLIFRYAAGLIHQFPVENPAVLAKHAICETEKQLFFQVEQENPVRVTLAVDESRGLYAGTLVLAYNPVYYDFDQMSRAFATEQVDCYCSHQNGRVKITFAAGEPLEAGKALFDLYFKPRRPDDGACFEIVSARFNEGRTPVHILNNGDTVVSRVFQVFENYPNPFNAATQFWFTLPQGDQKQLDVDIHNLLGQKVRVLFSGRLTGGYHKLIWDGCDNTGFPVPSGMYICRFRYGPRQELRKVLLIR